MTLAKAFNVASVGVAGFLGGYISGVTVERLEPPEIRVDSVYFNAPDSIFGPHIGLTCWIVNREWPNIR